MILPKTMRKCTSYHLLVEETISYFVTKQFTRYMPEQMKSKPATGMLLQVRVEEMIKSLDFQQIFFFWGGGVTGTN